jgi:hypothetical protein
VGETRIGEPKFMSEKLNINVSAVNTRVRFEQWAKNPTCDANTVSAVLNVPLGKVAEKLGFEDKKMLPPFAIIRGLVFEKYLFEDDAARLRKSMIHQKMIEAGKDIEFVDLRHQGNLQGKTKSAERSLELSRDLLEDLVSGAESTKTKLITGLIIKLAKGVMLPEATLILDCLLAEWQDDPERPHWKLKVGEIKIFPDRGGYTDPNQIASARAQAGVYKHGLDQWIIENKVEHAFNVDDFGFLVFTWPGSTLPVVRPKEDLRSQADRAKAGFDRMDLIGSKVVGAKAGKYSEAEYVDWVAHSETNFREACWEFCDLAQRCQDVALEQGRGIFLGSDVSRTLGSVSIPRSLELLNGSSPISEFEESLLSQLLEAESGLF